MRSLKSFTLIAILMAIYVLPASAFTIHSLDLNQENLKDFKEGRLIIEFKKGDSREALGLTGKETFDFRGLTDKIKPKQEISVIAHAKKGSVKVFKAVCRLDTQKEIEYYINGGILPTVLRKIIVGSKSK